MDGGSKQPHPEGSSGRIEESVDTANGNIGTSLSVTDEPHAHGIAALENQTDLQSHRTHTSTLPLHETQSRSGDIHKTQTSVQQPDTHTSILLHGTQSSQDVKMASDNKTGASANEIESSENEIRVYPQCQETHTYHGTQSQTHTYPQYPDTQSQETHTYPGTQADERVSKLQTPINEQDTVVVDNRSFVAAEKTPPTNSQGHPSRVQVFSKETQTHSWADTNVGDQTDVSVSSDTVATPSYHSILSSENYTANQQSESFDGKPSLKLDFGNESSSMSVSDNELESPVKCDVSTDDVLTMISEKDCRIAELETSVLDLQHQLQEFEHLHQSTQLDLKDTQNLLHKQRVNGVLNTEEDLSEIMAKIGSYESERESLQLLVEDERTKVSELERQREEAMAEMDQLKHKINTLSLLALSPNPSSSVDSSDTVMVDVDSVKQQLTVSESVLDNVMADTQEMQSQKLTVQRQCDDVEDRVEQLQASLRIAKHEAHRLQAITARKESELVKISSAIHATRAKLASLHKVERSTPAAAPGDNEQPQSDDENIKGLEWDVNTIKQKWEELCEELSNHEAAIASLTGRELTLQSELDRRAARVIELEALIQARELGEGFNKKSVSTLQTSLSLLRNELASTKKDHALANEQMEEVCQKLQSSVHTFVEQIDILKEEVSSKEKKIEELKAEQQQMWQLYQLNNNKLKEEEEASLAKEQRLQEANDELFLSKQRIEELEDKLAVSDEMREKDLEYQEAVLIDLISQLQQAVDNEDNMELPSMEPESLLQSRISHRDQLLQTLQDQTNLIIEQHANLVLQTEQRHDVVSDLESKLLSTQTLCDALEQEVADGHKRLAHVQRQLVESERERMELQNQLERLQRDAEDACNGLETALNKNALLKRESEEKLESVKRQCLSHQLSREESEHTATELLQVMEEKASEMSQLQQTIEGLEIENIRLQTDNVQQQTLIAKLKEEMDLTGYDSQSLQRDIVDKTVTVETLRSRLDEAESAKLIAEAIAEERLNDVMSLQQHNQQLLSTNAEMKRKFSAVDNMKMYQHKVDMLQEEIETVKAMYDVKSAELDKVKYSYQLSLKKETDIIEQLEECRRELAVCKKRADELDTRYQSTLTELSTTQAELDSLQSQHLQVRASGRGGANTPAANMTIRMKKLEKQLADSKKDFDEVQKKLQTTTNDKRRLLSKLGALEEHYHSLIRTSSQQKLDLDRAKRRCEEQRKLCVSIQNEHDSLAEQVSDFAVSNKTTTEALVEKIREQDQELSTLKHRQERILTDNCQLRKQLNQALPVVGGARPGPDGGGTLSLNELPQLHNQYQQILEKGLSSTSALDTSGYSSPTESTDELDKSYWIKRAGELSLQLQQSSEYWSNKVREQSLKIQKYESKQ